MLKPDISLSSVASLFDEMFGSRPELFSIGEGEESRAFAFDLGEDAYVLRINRTADGFAKDSYAGSRFAGPALPVPPVIDIGTLDDGHAYCVSRRAPGVTLQDLPASDLPGIVGPVCAVMDAIAACGVEGTRGFGPFDATGHATFESWRAFLVDIAAPSRHDWPATGVNEERVARLLDIMLDLTNKAPEERCLIHGDFGSNNVLTDGRFITGVIDWSEAMYGDPLYDIANILFWRSWLPCMEEQARHLEQSGRLGNPDRLRCYQLRIGLAEIYENAIAGTDENVSWALARCETIALED